jgi:hypothetical protein
MPMPLKDANVIAKDLHGKPTDAMRTFWIAVVAEGYNTIPERQEFRDRAQDFVSALIKQRAFATNLERFLVVAVDCTSKQSSRNLNENNPKLPEDTTPCDAFWGPKKLPVGSNVSVKKVLDWVRSNNSQYGRRGFNATLVLVNNTEGGGEGAGEVVYAWGRSSDDILVHELAHAFGLEDEYNYPVGNENAFLLYRGEEPVSANVTKQKVIHRIPWEPLLTPNVTIPCTHRSVETEDCRPPDRIWPDAAGADVVGLFEGGYHFACGIFRPSFKCRMNDEQDPFCPVCKHEIEKKLRGALFVSAGPRTAETDRAWTHVVDGERMVQGSDVSLRSLVAYDAVTGYAGRVRLAIGGSGGDPNDPMAFTVWPAEGLQHIGKGWSTVTPLDVGVRRFLICTRGRAQGLNTDLRAIFEVRINDNVPFQEHWREDQFDWPYTHVVALNLNGMPHLLSYDMSSGDVKLEMVDPERAVLAPVTLLSTRTGGASWTRGFQCLTALDIERANGERTPFIAAVGYRPTVAGSFAQTITFARVRPMVGVPEPQCLFDAPGSPHPIPLSFPTHAIGITLGSNPRKPYLALYSTVGGYVTLYAVRQDGSGFDYCDRRFIGLGGPMWLGTGAPALGEFSRHVWLHRALLGSPGKFCVTDLSRSG